MADISASEDLAKLRIVTTGMVGSHACPIVHFETTRFFVMNLLTADQFQQRIRPALAVALAALLVLGCACYRSGHTLGSAIHGANNGLAWLATGYSPTVVPRVAIVAPMVAVESLTVADLRILARQAGYKKLARSGRKAELVAVLTGEARP